MFAARTGRHTRRRERNLARWVVAVATAALLAAALVTALASRPLPAPPVSRVSRPVGGEDLFAYRASREPAFVARAVAGEAHVLFIKSPGGAYATAARVAAFTPQIDTAARGSGIDPATLGGIVFLESAGEPNAIAGTDPANAAGLTQIVAETGQSLLGMHINLSRSRTLTAEIDQAAALGRAALVARLERRRAAVDQRFVPSRALAATVRYLQLAHRLLGRWDLALASYHMGIGNLQDVLASYDGGRPVPYAQLFFDTAPDHHAAAYRLLSGFGDDSWTYYWRVLAAEQIMRLYRSDPGGLRRLATLQTLTDSAAYVLHPPGSSDAFATPAELDVAYARHLLVPLPSNASALGLAYDPSMGSLARRLGVSSALYRGLRPPARQLLIKLAGEVRTLSGRAASLTLTSSVIDRRYQRLIGIDDPATAAGWSFTIARSYARPAEAQAFQAVLERLQALDLIAWQRYPTEIAVTVASDAARVIASGP